MQNYLITCLLSLFVMACQSKDTHSEAPQTDTSSIVQDSKNDAEASFSEIKHFAEYTEDFQNLIISLDGLFRGVAIGMTKNDVKKVELAKLIKETPNSLQYKADLGSGEYADITYKLQNDKVSSLNATVYVSTFEAYGALNAELIDYYNGKLGAMEMVGEQETWKTSTNHSLTVKDILKEKQYIIEIEAK